MNRFTLRCLAAAALGLAGLVPPLAANAADDGTPLIVEDSWTYLIDVPGLYLDRAHADLRHGQPGLAAADVRKAAATIGDEAKLASGADQARLQRDARSLLQVAAQIDAGRIGGPRRLDLALVMARADLGAHHDLRAAEAWARKDPEAAGRSLAAAARYAEGALVTLDGKVAAGSTRDLRTVEGFGEHLADRTGTAVETEWERARGTLDEALATLSGKHGVPPAG
jgi:hypothetical protein